MVWSKPDKWLKKLNVKLLSESFQCPSSFYLSLSSSCYFSQVVLPFLVRFMKLPPRETAAPCSGGRLCTLVWYLPQLLSACRTITYPSESFNFTTLFNATWWWWWWRCVILPVTCLGLCVRQQLGSGSSWTLSKHASCVKGWVVHRRAVF